MRLGSQIRVRQLSNTALRERRGKIRVAMQDTCVAHATKRRKQPPYQS